MLNLGLYLLQYLNRAVNRLTDIEIIERYRNSHESKYIGELFIRYAHLVTGLCLKYFKDEARAKDAVMDIFEQNLNYLKKHNVHNYKSWLYTVSKNHCLQALRKEQGITLKMEDYKKTAELFMENDDDFHLNIQQQEEALKNALLKLKDHQKQCLELFYFQEKSYEEIAEQTGYDLKKVKSYIQNGKRNLKNMLKQNG